MRKIVMELSKLSYKVLRTLKVGDVVAVDREWTGRGKIVAPITAVEHRWGTDSLPLLTLEGHDPHWVGAAGEPVRHEASLQFGAHCVLEIVSRGAYVMVPQRRVRNVFAEYVAHRLSADRGYWNYPRKEAPKGQLCGRYWNMSELFMFALAKLPYELTTAFHEERAMKLWVAAGSPGLVHGPHATDEDDNLYGSILATLLEQRSCNHYFVREKPFCRFVRQNWSKLVMTKGEMHKQEDDYQDLEMRALERDFEDDQFGDDSQSHVSQPVDWVDANMD